MLELTMTAIGWVVRGLGHLLAELLIEKLFYGLGWLVLKVLTLGQFPPPRAGIRDRWTVMLVTLTGAAFLSISMIVLLS